MMNKNIASFVNLYSKSRYQPELTLNESTNTFDLKIILADATNPEAQKSYEALKESTDITLVSKYVEFNGKPRVAIEAIDNTDSSNSFYLGCLPLAGDTSNLGRLLIILHAIITERPSECALRLHKIDDFWGNSMLTAKICISDLPAEFVNEIFVKNETVLKVDDGNIKDVLSKIVRKRNDLDDIFKQMLDEVRVVLTHVPQRKSILDVDRQLFNKALNAILSFISQHA